MELDNSGFEKESALSARLPYTLGSRMEYGAQTKCGRLRKALMHRPTEERTRVKNDSDAWSECIARTLQEDEYVGKLRNAGFEDVNILFKRRFMGFVYSAEIEA